MGMAGAVPNEGPIPKSSIDAHVAGWDYDDADMFRHCIRAMDSFYLKERSGNNVEDEEQEGAHSARDAFRAAFSGRSKPRTPPSPFGLPKPPKNSSVIMQ